MGFAVTYLRRRVPTLSLVPVVSSLAYLFVACFCFSFPCISPTLNTPIFKHFSTAYPQKKATFTFNLNAPLAVMASRADRDVVGG